MFLGTKKFNKDYHSEINLIFWHQQTIVPYVHVTPLIEKCVLNSSVVFVVAGGCVKGDPQGWTHEESKKMLAAWASLLFLAMWVRNATSGPLSFRIGE